MLCSSLVIVPSGFPQNFTATDILSRSATLIWNPPLPEEQNGNITTYVINASVVGSGEMFTLISQSTVLGVDVLTPYTTYSILIAASTRIGTGPLSPVLMLQTPEDGQCNNFYYLPTAITIITAVCSFSISTHKPSLESQWSCSELKLSFTLMEPTSS